MFWRSTNSIDSDNSKQGYGPDIQNNNIFQKSKSRVKSFVYFIQATFQWIFDQEIKTQLEWDQLTHFFVKFEV